MSKSSKSKGKRYTAKQKAQILAYVDKINAQKGRGGITAAASRFGVTPLTISNWIKATGIPAVRGRPRGGGNFAANLRQLADLHENISKKETELAKLRREYAALKKKL
ncbi:MAG: hypothetical protein HKN82_10405 [Akkermansiaceae bacterium]|nr:hypothetical protein [Akkermansiaceae bacterium]NNM31093.1 hypothetical protein [Akkermansiaceae bacterium]